MNLSEEQQSYFDRAVRDGYLILHDYDPETHPDLELEWRSWCANRSAPFVKVEVGQRGATVYYSLHRFPSATHLTEAELEELILYSFQGRGSERSECFPDGGHIGLIQLSNALQIAARMVEFCRDGVRHWKAGASTARIMAARRDQTA
jgi:hypothetical protein